MKKTLLTLALFICFVIASNAQTTYNWAGGAGTAAAPITTWNTTWIDPVTSNSRASIGATATDILVFDGATTATVFLGSVPTDQIGQLIFQNNVNVTIMSTAGSTALSGTTTIGTVYGAQAYPATGTGTSYSSVLEIGDYVYITGTTANNCQVLNTTSATDATFSFGDPNAVTGSGLSLTKATTWYIKGNPGLNIGAGSTLNLGHASIGTLGYFVLKISPNATGAVYGTINLNTTGGKASSQGRVVACDAGSLAFKMVVHLIYQVLMLNFILLAHCQ